MPQSPDERPGQGGDPKDVTLTLRAFRNSSIADSIRIARNGEEALLDRHSANEWPTLRARPIRNREMLILEILPRFELLVREPTV